MNKFGRTKMMSLNGQNTKQLDRQELYTGITWLHIANILCKKLGQALERHQFIFLPFRVESGN